jgi:hypothetical protein
MCDHKESASIDISRRKMLGSLASLSLSLPMLAYTAQGQKRQAAAPVINGEFQHMVEAAQNFLNALGTPLQGKALLPAVSEERFNWHYIPTHVTSLPNANQLNLHKRTGVTLKEMTLDQRKAAHALLRSALSTQGYLKATAIMHLEDVLREIEITLGRNATEATAIRDPELYFFAFFGTPSKDAAWGWRVEGHHLSLHFSLIGNRLIAPVPAFMGSNPAVVAHGTHAGSRIFNAEEFLARELFMSFDAQQSAKALIATTAPNEIITKNNRKADLGTPVGLAAAKMTGTQRDLLMRLVQEYAGNFSYPLAETELKKIKADGLEKLHFVWAGSNELGKAHYYRIHSAKLLIEYDNSQNNANHIHMVYRHLENDFGVDMLRQHYEKSAHHK